MEGGGLAHKLVVEGVELLKLVEGGGSRIWSLKLGGSLSLYVGAVGCQLQEAVHSCFGVCPDKLMIHQRTKGFLIFYPQSRFLVGFWGCGVVRFRSVYEVRASVEGPHLQG